MDRPQPLRSICSTVLRLLGAWLPPHSEPEKWIAEEQELWRNDRIYSILNVLLSHAAERGTAADFVARVLTQDLASSFGVDRFAADAGSHERYIIGSAIAVIPDTANWFSELWAKLFHLRDRARRYRHRRDSQTPPNVGQVAVVWGLCGLGFIDPASEASRALWVQLEAAARESILMDGLRLHNDACCPISRPNYSHSPAAATTINVTRSARRSSTKITRP